MTGLETIEKCFAQAKAERRATFMPFFTVGYPDLPTSIRLLEALVQSGADALEVGMPFSDPVAEGPVIQHSSQVALRNGIRIKDCVQAIQTLRDHGVRVPLILMGYINPLLAYGLDRFVADSAAAGTSGFIIPDLPPDEAGEMTALVNQHEMAQVPLLAPTSTVERIRQVVSHARGYIYLVSVAGVTGARDTLPPDLADYVKRVRAQTTLPLAVGFGISKPEHARLVSSIADGVIVGSALVRLMESDGFDAVCALAARLRAACAANPTV